MKRSIRVSGAEALKRFIDEAHAKGINVISDVVYNHVHGDYNGLWGMGSPENPYFNWSKEPGKFEQRDTAWGAVPAYSKPQVKQLFVDHVVAQVEELHFDGLRFDFTEPIKGTGGQGPLPQPQRMDGGGAVRLRPEHHASDAEGRDGGRLRRAVVHGVPAPAGE